MIYQILLTISVNKRNFLEIINLYQAIDLYDQADFIIQRAHNFNQIKYFHLKQYGFWRNQ